MSLITRSFFSLFNIFILKFKIGILYFSNVKSAKKEIVQSENQRLSRFENRDLIRGIN